MYPSLPDLESERIEAEKWLAQFHHRPGDFECVLTWDPKGKERWQHSLDCPSAALPEMSLACPSEEFQGARRVLEGLDLLFLLPQCFLHPEAAAGQRILSGLISPRMLQSYR